MMVTRQIVWVAFVSFGVVVALPESACAVFLTTGVYDENTMEDNIVDVEAVSNNVSLAQFKTDVSAAFVADTGGVIDFDTDTLTLAGAAQSFSATYGATQSKTLAITLQNPVSALQHFLTGSDANSTPISGLQYWGTNGNADWTISFSEPLAEWGTTVLARNGSRTVTLSITLDDNSVVNWTPEAIASDTAGVDGADDTFFAYVAPVGRTIKLVTGDSSNFTRWDDMGFVVAVPEPGAAALALLAMVSGLVVGPRIHK